MSAYDDDTISAFVDGELDADRMAEIAAAARGDAELAARIETYRANDAILLRAVDDALNTKLEPVMSPVVSPIISNVITFPKKPRAASQGWVPAAIAAGIALVVGVVGTQVYTGDAMLVPAQTGLAANAGFANALSHLASGEARTVDGGTLRVALSFKAKDKRYCREFSVGFANGSAMGVACNQSGQWQIEGWTAAPSQSEDGYRTAGGPDDAALDPVMKRLGTNDTLDSARERAAIRAGWQDQGR